jgi:hypothetical protein
VQYNSADKTFNIVQVICGFKRTTNEASQGIKRGEITTCSFFHFKPILTRRQLDQNGIAMVTQ